MLFLYFNPLFSCALLPFSFGLSVSVFFALSLCPPKNRRRASRLPGKRRATPLSLFLPLRQLYLNKYGLSWALLLKTAASILEQRKGCMFRQQGPSKCPFSFNICPPSHTHTRSNCSSPDVQRCVWYATEDKTPTVWGFHNSSMMLSISLSGTYPEPCVSCKNYESAMNVRLQPGLQMSCHGSFAFIHNSKSLW